MVERDFEEKFVDLLINKYGYPRQAIKKGVRIGNFIVDIAIQKGTVYIQAFEFKCKYTPEVRVVYQRFSDVCVDTPFYCIVFDNSGKFKMYDCNIEKEVSDVAGVLNYDNAIARFFRPTLRDFDNVKKSISAVCYISVGIIIIYITIYIFCYICPCCKITLPLSSELITVFGFIIVLFLLPSLLKLWNYIKQIKIGAFELDLREEGRRYDTPEQKVN